MGLAASADHLAGRPVLGAQAVDNKDCILDEVDKALGVNQPPALEYILVTPPSLFRFPWLGLGFHYNSYGHAAVRYTMPDGKRKCVNIVGKREGRSLVHFTSPQDYLYGLTYEESSEQRGLYNRSMIGIRVEKLEPERIIAMDQYFKDLSERDRKHTAKFDIMLGPLYNMVPGFAERGNCARWTSAGLVQAGVTTTISSFPKSVWINIFENTHRTSVRSVENMHVVFYRRVRHAKREYGSDAEGIDAVAPLQSLRSVMYWNMERFAHVTVEVPEGETRAVVHTHENPAGPSEIRNFFNSKWAIIPSVLLTGAFLFLNFGSRAGRYNERTLRMMLAERRQLLDSLPLKSRRREHGVRHG